MTEVVIVVAAVVAHTGSPNVVEDVLDWGKTAGTVGTGIGPTVPTLGVTVSVGTAAGVLTPRLLISNDPNGIPVRLTPPIVVGDVDIGVEDEAMLLEPEPHIPDIPDVSTTIAEVVGIPDAPDIPEFIDVPDDIDVAVMDPTAVPPPSKVEVDPNIPDGAIPEVEHVVLLPGTAIVPVALAGIGLTPGDAISVAPRGMPVGETVAMPRGEVAPMVGVGVAVPLTCATATLQTKSAGRTAAINENLIGILRLKTASQHGKQ